MKSTSSAAPLAKELSLLPAAVLISLQHCQTQNINNKTMQSYYYKKGYFSLSTIFCAWETAASAIPIASCRRVRPVSTTLCYLMLVIEHLSVILLYPSKLQCSFSNLQCCKSSSIFYPAYCKGKLVWMFFYLHLINYLFWKHYTRATNTVPWMSPSTPTTIAMALCWEWVDFSLGPTKTIVRIYIITNEKTWNLFNSLPSNIILCITNSLFHLALSILKPGWGSCKCFSCNFKSITNIL